jgi:hypothetical protein
VDEVKKDKKLKDPNWQDGRKVLIIKRAISLL